MAQHRGSSGPGTLFGWMRRMLKPWQAAVVAMVLVTMCVMVVRGVCAGTSFSITRDADVSEMEEIETQVELEGTSFEQFQQGSGNIQDTSSIEVEDVQVRSVFIDVDGAVMSPGVYELEGESPRVNDAVTAAGGLAEDADTSRVNLAALLEDGSKVYIPHAGEAVEAPVSGGSGAANAVAGEVETSGDSGLVNINTATSEELQRLPGVGEATAAAIIRDREANGAFASPEDIMRVSGIGEKKFEKMRDMICV